MVKTTPKSGDFGADLVLSKDGVDTVVQAKRWNMVVGIEAVQQIVAAKQYYGARNAMVITNSEYTPTLTASREKNTAMSLSLLSLRPWCVVTNM